MTNIEKLNFINSAITKLTKKGSSVSPDDVLIDIGLDSLDIVEIQLLYEETFKIELPDNITVSTVKDLMDLMI
jgi:acyl carrier protein